MSVEPSARLPDLIDLTQEMYEGMPVYDGLVTTRVWQHQSHDQTRLADGSSYASCGIVLSDHAGTHVDAPSHTDASATAPSIDRLPLEMFFGPALCLDLSTGNGPITCRRLQDALVASGQPLNPGDVLLLHTGVYDRCGGSASYLVGYQGLDDEACAWVVGRAVKALGVDQPSPDDADGSISPAHTTFGDAHILIYENLANLGQIAGRRFQFAGFPILLRGCTGAFVRAVALLERAD